MIFFGNYCLQNKRIKSQFDGSRSSAGIDVQGSQIARGDGMKVVNTRRESKIIDISGVVEAHNLTLSDAILEFDKIFFRTDRESILRVVPEYHSLINKTSTNGWAISGSGSLSVDEGRFQTENNSILFTDGSSTETTITINETKANNLSGKAGNIEVILYGENANRISNVRLRMAEASSSGTDFYEHNFISDYQLRNFENGALLLSVPVGALSETGTPSLTNITWFQIQITHLNEVEAYQYIDNILYVEESQVRNYPVYLSGEVQKGGTYAERKHITFDAKFLNHTGYARSTHRHNLFSEDGVTGSSDTQSFVLDGSTYALPRFVMDISDATNLTDLTIRNVNNNQAIDFIPETVSDGDSIVFGGLRQEVRKGVEPLDFGGIIPRWDKGANKARLAVSGTSLNALIPASAITKTGTRQNTGDGRYFFIAQSFLTPGAGTITKFSVDIGNSDGQLLWFIMDNSGGEPNNVLDSDYYNFPPEGTNTVDGLNVAVTGATIYYLVLRTRWYEPSPAGDIIVDTFWDFNSSSAVYADGEVLYSDAEAISGPNPELISSWTAQTGQQVFRITQSGDASWDIDWSADYYKLYK
jgi:hypothetical protein